MKSGLMAMCESCKREMDLDDLLETPLYFVCLDPQECIAALSGWLDPPDNEEQ